MGRLKKVIVALLVIVLLATTIVAVRVHIETRKRMREVKFDYYIYARNYACMLVSCTRKGSEYEYTLEKTPNTDAVIEYLQKEGYPITYEIIETDYEKGMKVLQRFRKDHGIEHIEAVREFFVTSLAGEGYTWKFDGDDTYWYE
ncbi:MAG: hypothetical protein K5744_01085 [Eubacterium sp.]|nr:hypothetical protein [Eubacterium sp.]